MILLGLVDDLLNCGELKNYLFYIKYYLYNVGVAEPDKVLDDVQSERIIILLCTTTER